jgi:hypothetical protein
MSEADNDLCISSITDMAQLVHFLPEFQIVTTQNVWEYFKTSVFYDRSCLNEYIAMQGSDVSKLDTEDGVFYKVFNKEHGIFNIIEYLRETIGSVRNVVPCKCFYVFDGRIYMAPTLMAVVSKCVRNVAHQVMQSLILTEQFVTFKQPEGHHWDFTHRQGGKKCEDTKDNTIKSEPPPNNTITESAAHVLFHEGSREFDDFIQRVTR